MGLICKRSKWNKYNEKLAENIYQLLEEGKFPTAQEALVGLQLIYKEKWDYCDWDNPKMWDHKVLGNWGTARPDNDCVLTDANIKIDSCSNTLKLWSKHEPNGIDGLGYKGKEVETRFFSGAQIRSKFTISPEGRYSALIRIDAPALGVWESFWFLHDADVDGKYREIDFERFAEAEQKNLAATFTTHNKVDKKLMYHRRIENFLTTNELLVEFEFVPQHKMVKAFLNGVLAFCTDIRDLMKNYNVLFSVYVKKWDLPTQTVIDSLPSQFTIYSFKKYEKRR